MQPPVPEVHVLKRKVTATRQHERRRILARADLRSLQQELLQRLHVGRGLPYAGVQRAQDLQRHRQLEDEPLNHHEVSHAHAARRTFLRCEHHREAEPRREDGRLPKVEARKGHLRRDRRLLVLGKCRVVPARLVRRCIKILHGFIIEHRVCKVLHRLGVGGILRLAHLGPRSRDRKGKGRVGRERHECDGAKRGAAFDGQQRRDRRYLECQGQHLQHRGRKQRPEGACAALDSTSERARAPRKVEAELERVQVRER